MVVANIIYTIKSYNGREGSYQTKVSYQERNKGFYYKYGAHNSGKIIASRVKAGIKYVINTWRNCLVYSLPKYKDKHAKVYNNEYAVCM